MKIVPFTLVQNILTTNKNVFIQIKGPDIYGHKGDYIGKISDIFLGKNRIDSLKIKMDKKRKSGKN